MSASRSVQGDRFNEKGPSKALKKFLAAIAAKKNGCQAAWRGTGNPAQNPHGAGGPVSEGGVQARIHLRGKRPGKDAAN